MAGQEAALGLQRDSENSGIFTDLVDIGDSVDFYLLHREIEPSLMPSHFMSYSHSEP